MDGLEAHHLDETSNNMMMVEEDRTQDIKAASELSAVDQLAFQAELWKLLAQRTSLYTMGESSSVPELTAHRLLSSVCFMLGIDDSDLDVTTMHRLLEDGLETTFNQNLEFVIGEVKRTATLWEAAALSTPLLESTALKDTLESLKNFPVQYDYRSFAHEIPSDIDYPLAQPVSEARQGVVYVNEYLTRLSIENGFMQRFELSQCKALLRKVSPEYRELIINLYEPIAVNAIGLAFAGCKVHDLSVSKETREHIVELCRERPKRVLEQMLAEASLRVCAELRIEDEQVREYIRKTALALRERVARLVTGSDAKTVREGLAGVFLSF